MAVNVQARGGKYQLRVRHALLPKDFFHTFGSPEEAYAYGNQLDALLGRGVIPQELVASSTKALSPLLIEVMRDYERDPNLRIAATEMPTLALLAKEAPGVRMAGITFAWVNGLINTYKTRELSPGTIRKRIGALGKVDAYYHRRQAKDGQQPQMSVLSMLPKGYSQYADGAVKDVKRDQRMSAAHEAAVFEVLRGAKRDDRERPWVAGGDPALEMLFRLIVDTGLRLREAYWLRVEQLDAEKGLLHVDGTKGHHGAIKRRTVPLKRELRSKLADWCEGKKGLIFPFWNGTQEDLVKCTARLSARFASLFEYAGVPQFTEHDLRHEACCRWVQLRGQSGWLFNDIEICKIMGWTNANMMLRYASLRGEDLADRLR